MTDGHSQDGEGPHELRSYGRRRGRKLSPAQERRRAEMLPGLALDLAVPAPADVRRIFGAPVGQVWLEIGFGGAEHLLWQAVRNPRAGIIGCEPFEEGIAKALAGIEREGLRNVRLHDDDARDLLRWLPQGSLDRAFVLFPDPWPKRKHRKRRLVSAPTLALLARALRPGGELRVASDIGDYVRSMLVAFRQTPEFSWCAEGPADWQERPSDWPATRYEQKALQEGRRPAYLRFLRR
jgi:tRNA (guanine-N7-)-methyltransferase